MFSTPLRRFATRDNSLQDSEDLRRDRARCDKKLESRLEHIFSKYGKHFEGVGDEIDLVTGQVVVDNGHLAHMQHERDVGSTPSDRFLRAFTQELGGEDHQESRALDRMRAQSRTPDVSALDSGQLQRQVCTAWDALLEPQLTQL